jgi:hypothetical protein
MVRRRVNGSESERDLEPYCFLERHSECLLEQFYGRSLDCECECHDHQHDWSPIVH